MPAGDRLLTRAAQNLSHDRNGVVTRDPGSAEREHL
jgi:hypothetical protein